MSQIGTIWSNISWSTGFHKLWIWGDTVVGYRSLNRCDKQTNKQKACPIVKWSYKTKFEWSSKRKKESSTKGKKSLRQDITTICLPSHRNKKRNFNFGLALQTLYFNVINNSINNSINPLLTLYWQRGGCYEVPFSFWSSMMARSPFCSRHQSRAWVQFALISDWWLWLPLNM